MVDSGEVIVVGSTNIDLITYTHHIPAAGQTVVGDRFQMGLGGKGANQAVMARLLGSEVSMVSCLGDDAYGQMYLDNFAGLGVDISHVYRAAGSTGVAPIWVEPDGTNRIIIVPGANNALTTSQASAAVSSHPDAAVVIGQFEIPQAVTIAAFRTARAQNTLTVLNPAPAAAMAPGLVELTDWMIPNEVEFHLISGGDPTDEADLVAFALKTGCRLLVTMGAQGVALVSSDGQVTRMTAEPVAAVDTTGAGDAFVGAFAHGLARGLDEVGAIRLAMACAADSVTRHGTQTSFPNGRRCLELIEAIETPS